MNVLKKILLSAFISVVYSVAFTQSIRINKIELYGNRKISSTAILSYIDKKEVDSINPKFFKPDFIISTLKRNSGIKHVTVNPICCDTSNGYVLYIGVAESNAVILKHRPTPKEYFQLPNEIITAYRNFNKAVRTAVMRSESSEEYADGYSLVKDGAAREEQIKFISFAKHKLQLIANVLKYSKHAEHRAAAAQIIAYSTDKKLIVENLLYAIEDENEDVRNNATRALSILAGYLLEHPEIKVTIPATPFIAMLNSISWTDRNKGAMVLAQLTQSRDSSVLSQIKKHAGPSLVEMAKWHNREHAIFSFIILGRIAGEDDMSLFAANFSKEWIFLLEDMIKKCDFQ